MNEDMGKWALKANARESVGQGLPGRILLVEDNRIIAMNTGALLQELGVAHVEVAASVATAMALIAVQSFDLAILDYDLGNETSIPVAERLHARETAVIFSTGYGDTIALPDTLAGAAVLKKPYTFTDLDRMLRQR